MLTNLQHSRRADDRDGGQKFCAPDLHGDSPCRCCLPILFNPLARLAVCCCVACVLGRHILSNRCAIRQKPAAWAFAANRAALPRATFTRVGKNGRACFGAARKPPRRGVPGTPRANRCMNSVAGGRVPRTRQLTSIGGFHD
jgi:hypothetical protein